MSHWIKIEVTTPDKPEIIAAAEICGASEADAFLAFFRLWSYFDAHTATGVVAGLHLASLDRIAGLKGFGQAMGKVGWITEDATGIVINGWERHNGKSAKARGLMEKRVQKYRAGKQWKRNV